jgi:uncharacterized protein DUF2568
MTRQGNLVLAFALEVAGLAIFSYWGSQTGTSIAAKVALGALAPLAAAALWGLFAAPRAPVASTSASMATQVALFGAATLALWATGHTRLAYALMGLVLFNHMVSYFARK